MFNKETTTVLNLKRDFIFDILSEDTDLDLMKVGSTDLQFAEDFCLEGYTDACFNITHECDNILHSDEHRFFNNDVTGAMLSCEEDRSMFRRDLVRKVREVIAKWS